jgi:3-methyladenine DNA glycosylase AlkD
MASARQASPTARAKAAVARLKKMGSGRVREEALLRYGITAPKSFGVKMGPIQALAKELGTDHALAAALWKTGWYEARLLCAYVDDPEEVTSAQMDGWMKDFDNWGIVDTICFKLFDRTPYAWAKVRKWSTQKGEHQKRAAFALLASLALHDRKGPDGPFLKALPLIEKAATDERNFVKKGVNWALRAIGTRNLTCKGAAKELARRLADSTDPTSRWIGKDALRAFRR